MALAGSSSSGSSSSGEALRGRITPWEPGSAPTRFTRRRSHQPITATGMHVTLRPKTRAATWLGQSSTCAGREAPTRQHHHGYADDNEPQHGATTQREPTHGGHRDDGQRQPVQRRLGDGPVPTEREPPDADDQHDDRADFERPGRGPSDRCEPADHGRTSATYVHGCYNDRTPCGSTAAACRIYPFLPESTESVPTESARDSWAHVPMGRRYPTRVPRPVRTRRASHPVRARRRVHRRPRTAGAADTSGSTPRPRRRRVGVATTSRHDRLGRPPRPHPRSGLAGRRPPPGKRPDRGTPSPSARHHGCSRRAVASTGGAPARQDPRRVTGDRAGPAAEQRRS